MSEPSPAVFFTAIDVRVERNVRRTKHSGVFNLTVEIDYVEPDRARRRSKLWAGAGEDSYLYRFEMPVLLFGQVRVGVPDWDAMHKSFMDGDIRIASIDIYNAAHGGSGASSRIHWEASAEDPPRDWIVFENLLVRA